jgi:hypothetical protein
VAGDIGASAARHEDRVTSPSAPTLVALAFLLAAAACSGEHPAADGGTSPPAPPGMPADAEATDPSTHVIARFAAADACLDAQASTS